jgi:hypothetical protein
MLDELKAQPLSPIIANPKWGYELCKKTSTKATAVYRRPGERLICYLRPQKGGFYYFSNGETSGTAVDFLQLQGLSWGEIHAYTPPTFSPLENKNVCCARLKDNTKPHQEVLDHLTRQPRWHVGSYLQQRGINLPEIVLTSLSADLARNCYKVVAPLCDLKGSYIGWASCNGKNDQLHPNSKRITGRKGWFKCGALHQQVRYVVLCESIIDALSCAQLVYNKSPKALQYTSFLSTQGQPSGWQLEKLDDYLTACTQKKEVILCFDNDEQGVALDELLHKKLPKHNEFFTIKKPPSGKDWNEYLIHSLY